MPEDWHRHTLRSPMANRLLFFTFSKWNSSRDMIWAENDVSKHIFMSYDGLGPLKQACWLAFPCLVEIVLPSLGQRSLAICRLHASQCTTVHSQCPREGPRSCVSHTWSSTLGEQTQASHSDALCRNSVQKICTKPNYRASSTKEFPEASKALPSNTRVSGQIARESAHES